MGSASLPRSVTPVVSIQPTGVETSGCTGTRALRSPLDLQVKYFKHKFQHFSSDEAHHLCVTSTSWSSLIHLLEESIIKYCSTDKQKFSLINMSTTSLQKILKENLQMHTQKTITRNVEFILWKLSRPNKIMHLLKTIVSLLEQYKHNCFQLNEHKKF